MSGNDIRVGMGFRKPAQREDVRAMPTDAQRERWRTAWNKQSRFYDRQMSFLDRALFKDTRAWVCAQAHGEVLEVAVGTGLNLALYPPNTRVTGVDFSPAMLELAHQRAARLDRAVDLRLGDAEALDMPDACLDTVVCTFSLCAIPDHEQALAEMLRVLRPDGRLLLADHVISSARPVRAAQHLLEVVTAPMAGEHYLRRPSQHIHDSPRLHIEHHERFGLGIVERLAARKGCAGRSAS